MGRNGERHHHTPACYETVLACVVVPHQHGDGCYYQRGERAGQLKCSYVVHAHGSGCWLPRGPNCGYV